jgi:predicted metal-dependent hydrolase
MCKANLHEARQLWLWHALEENEHKTVAYDVYEKVVGSYALRVGIMIPTTVIFFAVTCLSFIY